MLNLAPLAAVLDKRACVMVNCTDYHIFFVKNTLNNKKIFVNLHTCHS